MPRGAGPAETQDLVHQVLLKRRTWCTRPNCPGCREDRQFSHLLRNSQTWYTRMGAKWLATRLSHTRLNAASAADDLAALIKRINATTVEDEPTGAYKIAGWIAPPGASWHDYLQRHAFVPILLQTADAPGPQGWTRVAPWPQRDNHRR